MAQPSTTETIPFIIRQAKRKRKMKKRKKMVLSVLGSVVLGTLIVFYSIYNKTASLMTRLYANESDECNKQQSNPVEKTIRLRQSGKCILPAYPGNGGFIIKKATGETPGESFEFVKLTFICLPGFRVLGNEEALCHDGIWNAPVPKCVRFCELAEHPSVLYHCLVNGSSPRACNRYEPSETVVKPECKSPYYYSAVALPFMRCINGSWDYVAVCSPECGRVTLNGGVGLIYEGRSAKPAEFPWHVGVYRKTTRPYMQICSGAIISNRVVSSAAHCFWEDATKQQPASLYAVAAGKIYRPWHDKNDVYAQKSDVNEIHIPRHFQGNEANLQSDIALLILVTPFVFHPYVRLVCLDFDPKIDKRQLQPGNVGKVAGWGLTSANGEPSQVLKVVEVRYVDYAECFASCPPSFKGYISSDKMCAGFGNGTGALCMGDSGGGLVFTEYERGTPRDYLRGIVSAVPTNDDRCNTNPRNCTTFTQIQTHEHFINGVLRMVDNR